MTMSERVIFITNHKTGVSFSLCVYVFNISNDTGFHVTCFLNVFYSYRYQHLITSPVLPHPYFPFSPLVAPANTGVSLPLQLMKATVLAESYYISSIFNVIYELQRCLPTVAKQVSLSFLLVNTLFSQRSLHCLQVRVILSFIIAAYVLHVYMQVLSVEKSIPFSISSLS